ncbi:MAG: 6-carboxytetrahydropterin synthase [Bdellovibrionales bacterium]|nr:6-carboxytetrahydropterin synthase [Bdellovibrionales bacterium]
MSFKSTPTSQHHTCFNTALGAKLKQQTLSYVADIEVVTPKKPNETLSFHGSVIDCGENTEVDLVCGVYDKFQSKFELNYIKVTLDQNKTLYFDGEMFLYSHPFIINCAHRHYNPELSEQENKELYYKCFYPHGHEYQLYITVSADKNFQFEQLIDWGDEQIVKVFDKSFLNDKMGNTSGELILEFFSQKLQEHPHPNLKLVNLTLKETFKNSFVKVYDNDLHYLF